MTQQELKAKLDASIEKLEARKNTIAKLCGKLNVNYDALMKAYDEKRNALSKGEYFKSIYAKEIVDKFVEKKPAFSNGTWDRAADEFNSKVEQLADNLPKLFEIENTTRSWEEKYDNQANKENSQKIEVIWNFLTDWETRAREWYINQGKRLVDQMNKFQTIASDYLIEIGYDTKKYLPREEAKEFVQQYNQFFNNNYNITPRYKWSDVDVEDWLGKYGVDQFTRELATVRFDKQDNNSYDQIFGYPAHKGEYVLKAFDYDKLDKVLAQEKLNKYYDLCDRISKVVGEITNASDLKIGYKNGELNGIVEGTKGKAKVETVGAGGYNTDIIVNVKHGQIFHYRVLVTPIKD